MSDPPAGAFARLERFAASPAGPTLVAAWAFLEAIVLPVVPDVALCLLVLAAPRRALILFGALVAGSLAGTVVLYALASVAPEQVTTLILAIPGIDESMLAATQALVASGNPLAIAQVGPGTPLKVDTLAWALGPDTPLALLAGAALNRVTRIGPALVFVLALGLLAPRWLRRHERIVLLAYATFWIVLYALYLG